MESEEPKIKSKQASKRDRTLPLNQYWTVLATVVFLSPDLYSCKSPTKFESGTTLSLDGFQDNLLKGIDNITLRR